MMLTTAQLVALKAYVDGDSSLTAGFTAGKNWTAEPTVLTVLDEWLLTPNGGLALVDIPLGNEYDSALAEGFVIRCTAPATVNVRATMDVSRI